MPAVNKLIRASDHDFRIKAALYDFMIDPYSVIRRVSHELMVKEIQLSKQYEQNAGKLLALQNELDVDKLFAGLNSLKGHEVSVNDYETLYISWTHNCKNHVYIASDQKTMLLVMGADYADTLQMAAEETKAPDLHEVGTALSEANRVAILNMIREKGEVSLKDIEKELSLAATNAYYHLAFMTRVGLLYTQVNGRSTRYRIDKQFFQRLADALREYAKPDEEDRT